MLHFAWKATPFLSLRLATSGLLDFASGSPRVFIKRNVWVEHGPGTNGEVGLWGTRVTNSVSSPPDQERRGQESRTSPPTRWSPRKWPTLPLLKRRLAPGEVPTGAQGEPRSTAGSARAYGYVSGSTRTITRSQGVVGDATIQQPGVYCITLSPCYYLASVVVLTGVDYAHSSTHPRDRGKGLCRLGRASGNHLSQRNDPDRHPRLSGQRHGRRSSVQPIYQGDRS